MKVLYSKEQLEQIEKNVMDYLKDVNSLFDNKLEFDVHKTFDDSAVEILQAGIKKYGNTTIDSDTILCIEFDEDCDMGDRVKYSPEVGFYLEDEEEYCEETDTLLAGVYNAESGERVNIKDLYLLLDTFVLSMYDELQECYEITADIDDSGISDLHKLPNWTIEQIYEKVYTLWESKGIKYFPAEAAYTEKTDGGLYVVTIRYEWRTDTSGNRHVEAVEVDRRKRAKIR